METEMNIENYSHESTTTDSIGDSGGSFSPPLKRLCKVTSTTATAYADAADDTDNKISSTRSSISEEFGGPHLLQPSDTLQQTAGLTITCTSADDADIDTDNKTSSTRSSISEEVGGPHLLQPSDPLQKTAVGEEIGKRRCTTLEEYVTNKYSWEECKDFLRTIDPRPQVDPQSEIETWQVDPDRLACYARQALKYFKEMTGEYYLYNGPRSMCLCSLPESEYKVTHINFFARPCGETLESLFFAALEHGPVRKVVECCTVPLFKSDDGVVPCIKHPPQHVDCSECLKFGDSAFCFEAEEEMCCDTCSYWSSV